MSLTLSRRSALLAGAGFAVSFGLVGCGDSGSGAAKGLRVGYQKNGVFLLAKQRGAFDKVLLAGGAASVEWIEFPAGPPLLEALSVGSIDLGGTGDTPPIFAQAAGAPLRYVAVQRLSGAAGGILTPANSGITDLKGLKGRRLAFTRGSSAHNQAVVALESAGLTLADVEAVNLGPADAAAAFQQGGIDGWVIWDPYYTAAIQNQGARVLVPGASMGGGAAYVLANAKFVEANPDLLRKALSAIAAEAKWAEQNRGAVAEMMARETGLPLPLVQDTVQRADFAFTPMTAEVAAAQQAVADRFHRLGVIPAPIKVADATWTGWDGT